MPLGGSSLLLHRTNSLLDICFESFRDACRGAFTQKNPANVLRSHLQFASEGAVVRLDPLEAAQVLNQRAKMSAQIETSVYRGQYSERNIKVKKNIPNGVIDPARERVAVSFRELRQVIGYSQAQMATALGVTQGQVAKWENPKYIQSPTGQVFVALSRMAPESQREYWLKLAGHKHGEIKDAVTTRSVRVPVLRDSAAAGTPRAVDETEWDYELDMPPQLLPHGGKLYGLKIEGDSMSPIVETGYTVFVDVTQRDPKLLVGTMVAARNEGGVTIKWLQQQGEIFLLVPQNVSRFHKVGVILPGSGADIVGRVVNWIGVPPAPSKRR